MQTDLPHTLFNHDKKKKKGKKGNPNENYTFNPNDKAIRLQEEANRKMREKRLADGGEPQYTLEELFRK